MDFNLNKFLAEQDAISAIPDEDVNAYARRLANQPSRCAATWKYLQHMTEQSDFRRMNRTDWSYEIVAQIVERDHRVTPGDLHRTAQSQGSSAVQEDAENEIRRWRTSSFFVGLSDKVPEGWKVK